MNNWIWKPTARNGKLGRCPNFIYTTETGQFCEKCWVSISISDWKMLCLSNGCGVEEKITKWIHNNYSAILSVSFPRRWFIWIFGIEQQISIIYVIFGIAIWYYTYLHSRQIYITEKKYNSTLYNMWIYVCRYICVKLYTHAIKY